MIVWHAHERCAVHDLAFLPGGRLITSGDDATRLWDVSTQTELTWWIAGHAVNLAVSPDGRWVVGAGSGRLWRWEVDGNFRSLLRGEYNGGFATFSPDGRFVVRHGGFECQLFRSAVEGEDPGRWGGPPAGRSQSYGPLVFSPDGRLLATADEGGSGSLIALRDGDTGEVRSSLWPSVTTPRATRLAFSPDGKLLASIHGPTLVLWDMVTRREYGRGRVAKKPFMGVTFTTDGSRMLTASNDTHLRVWTAPTWDQTTIYGWDAGKLGCVAVSADGTLAAAGGSTGKVVVWDLD